MVKENIVDERRPVDKAEFRKRAEKVASEKKGYIPENVEDLSPEEIRQLIHELYVHQIQLEMQNEEMHKTQLELEESRTRYRDLYDLAPVGYCTISDKGQIIEANLTAENLFGVSQGTLATQQMSRFILTEDQDVFYLHRKHILGTKEPHICEIRMLKKDGVQFWARMESVAVLSMDDRNTIRTVVSDISERKRIEEALKESEEKLKKAQRVAHVGSWEWDIVNDHVEWSDEMYHIFGIEKSEISGKLGDVITRIIHPEDLSILQTANVLVFTEREPIEYRIIWPDKSIRHILSEPGDVIFNAEGKPIYLIGTCQDITERKQAEDKIKFLLAEKELILKEVHHRIKNNMNTLNAFLFLQAGTLKEPTAIAALEDAGNRVQSMMVLYDKLYQSAGFNELSIRKYLPALVEQIVRNFPNSACIRIEENIEDFLMDAKRLQSLGIIVNEIITNIMKYAFIGRNEGLITIEVTSMPSKADKGNHAILVIQDNGNGLPESVDFEKSSGFGLMLVGMLTKQLKGIVRIERENGTKIILEFPL